MATIKQIKDTNGTVHDIIDTKVTSADNHYTPTANSTSELTATLSGTAGSFTTDTEYTVLTGVNAQRDAKGHVTGLTYTAQKVKDTNTVFTAGAFNNPNLKLFLVGAPSQPETATAGIITYSNVSCFIGSDNCLYSNGEKVLTSSSSSTDTKNTAGATNTNSKIYLVGATAQSANPQTYSHSSVFVNTDHSIHALKFYQDSDERLKTFTEDYDVNLDDIKNIKTGRFYWNSDESQEINGGVSAQTVEAYFPELVKENENGIKSVNYDGLAVVAIAAIKKLTERIEQLEDIIRNK